MDHTLREVTDALWKTRGGEDGDERQRIYDRGRMLRDRGLITTSSPSKQGRTMTFSDADAVAAVLALTASLNGASWGIIAALNGDLRAINNTQGRPRFEESLEDVRAGTSLFVRLDVRNEPWGHTEAKIGPLSEVNLDEGAGGISDGTTQVFFWPITQLAKPVLELLASGKAMN